MARYEIYNMNAGEDLGIYAAETKEQALDLMAQSYGFRNYADCIREYGVTLDEAIAELQIKVLPK